MGNFKGIFKVSDASGKCIQYVEGDIVYKNGEAYIAQITPTLCLSPEHKASGWKPLTNESSGTSVTFYNSATPPTRVSQGDEWFNPNSGILYKYIIDATSEQWVQIF
jgi:hypothetical protein